MANTFNQFQETQFSALGQQRLSEQDKFLIEALLVDRGILAGAVAVPTPTPAPAPAPSPTPAPAPTPSQAGSITVNTFLRLAMTPVSPGDLITARFVNDMVAALLELDRRVTELEGGIGKTTPTPSATPAPSPASSASLSAGKSQPIIASVQAVTVKGRGVSITVTGDNMGEGLLERVLLGPTAIAPSSIKFAGGSFSFLTTTAIVTKAANRLTVVTHNGEDSAPITASRAPQ
ncbi:MAG: hypothetical protein MT490_16980 [Sphingomonas sp.]|uniref:hypothetical protein n=1 Tax=Sphingomonas sp. TaxID=28214 RepID=UPI0022754E5D|nr:hypothetical protein [Sphingomonas sp.]MCX8477486.1 hypothetical protein [Sphingomonas sp.]